MIGVVSQNDIRVTAAKKHCKSDRHHAGVMQVSRRTTFKIQQDEIPSPEHKHRKSW